MKLDLTYDDKPYQFDTDVLSLADAFTVKTITGQRPGEFVNAIFELDPHAWLAMIVLARRRAGEACLAKDINQDKIDLVGQAEALVASLGKEVADAAEALGRKDEVAAVESTA